MRALRNTFWMSYTARALLSILVILHCTYRQPDITWNNLYQLCTYNKEYTHIDFYLYIYFKSCPWQNIFEKRFQLMKCMSWGTSNLKWHKKDSNNLSLSHSSTSKVFDVSTISSWWRSTIKIWKWKVSIMDESDILTVCLQLI